MNLWDVIWLRHCDPHIAQERQAHVFLEMEIPSAEEEPFLFQYLNVFPAHTFRETYSKETGSALAATTDDLHRRDEGVHPPILACDRQDLRRGGFMQTVPNIIQKSYFHRFVWLLLSNT